MTQTDAFALVCTITSPQIYLTFSIQRLTRLCLARHDGFELIYAFRCTGFPCFQKETCTDLSAPAPSDETGRSCNSECHDLHNDRSVSVIACWR